MNNIDTAVIFDGQVNFAAQGKEYSVKPIPLRYIANNDFQQSGLIFPVDRNEPGRQQIYNLVDEERRESLDKFMSLCLFHKGVPTGLETAIEHDWNIEDIGRFLDMLVQASG